MRIHVLSDLHLLCCPLEPAEVAGDVLVLAGDITDGRRETLFEFARNYLICKRPVLFVPGNHEFYGHLLARELKHLWRTCRRYGVELLYNRALTIGHVRFAGTTLWTDFALDSDPIRSMRFAEYGMTDYTQIGHGRRKLAPPDTIRMHKRALRFLERTFQEPHAGPTVVVTHHGPHPGSIHSRFAGHPLNPGFISDLSVQIARWAPACWIHGHVHNRFDYYVGQTRVVANPRGYVTQYRLPSGEVVTRTEHDAFNPTFVVEI